MNYLCPLILVLFGLFTSIATAQTTDAIPPVVSSVLPADGDVVTTGPNDITVRVVDDTSDVSEVQIYIKRLRDNTYWNGSDWVAQWSWNSATQATNDEWYLPAVDIQLLSEYKILFWAWDDDDNLANWFANPQPTFSAVWNDISPPNLSSITPATGTRVPTGLVDVSVLATDNTGVAQVRMLVQRTGDGMYWDGASWTEDWTWLIANQAAGDMWEIEEVDASQVGSYRVFTWAWDDELNIANWFANPQPTFSVVSGDNSPPNLSSVTPTNGTSVPNGLVDVSVLATDNTNVDLVRMVVQRTDDGMYWGGASWTVDRTWLIAHQSAGDVWEIKQVDVSQVGSYRVFIWAWDDEQNLAKLPATTPHSVFRSEADDSRLSETDDASPNEVVNDSPPNFVVILSDDQPSTTLKYMPILQEKLAARGVTFESALATNPECCPFRASALSGGYHTHNTGVLRNTVLNGQRHNFDESLAMPVLLQNAGYDTCFVGRYMHGYHPWNVPPGWDTWVANSYHQYASYTDLKNVTFYDGVTTTVRDVNQYVTDFQSDQAIDCIEKADEDPFFIWVGLFAPHTPYFAAPEDIGTFNDWDSPRPVSADEEDLSDKPAFIQQLAAYSDPIWPPILEVSGHSF